MTYGGQSYEQANHGRNGPQYSVQFSRDLATAARSGSPQAKRRVRILVRFMFVAFVIFPLVTLLLAEIMN